jgi:anti-sigma regulatory factor (Ser/Thr protein kinase)
MVTAVAAARLITVRQEPNLWWVALSDVASTDQTLARLRATSMPSEALALLDLPANAGGAAVVAKLELDVCGAWLTVANACVTRPVVVRRAGWVDLRGHPCSTVLGDGSYDACDDRVGLGPGDVLVLHVGSDIDDGDEVNSAVINACIDCAGQLPSTIADSVLTRIGGQVAAIGVPAELGAEPLTRVAAATGIPAHDVRSPGYPLGDLQPDLWKQPPRPPRLARLHLSAERSSLAAVRSLLDRLLASWRLDGRIDPDDVKLVATELAANAVVHSGTPQTVTVRYLGDKVRIEVSDKSFADPVPRHASLDAVGGRGLALIEALSSSWGTEHFDDGKCVWSELAVTAG